MRRGLGVETYPPGAAALFLIDARIRLVKFVLANDVFPVQITCHMRVRSVKITPERTNFFVPFVKEHWILRPGNPTIVAFVIFSA